MIRPVGHTPGGSQPQKKEPSRALLALSEQVEEAAVGAFIGLRRTNALQGRVSFDRGAKKGSRGNRVGEKMGTAFNRALRKASR
jgi:hypothetical protein